MPPRALPHCLSSTTSSVFVIRLRGRVNEEVDRTRTGFSEQVNKRINSTEYFVYTVMMEKDKMSQDRGIQKRRKASKSGEEGRREIKEQFTILALKGKLR